MKIFFDTEFTGLYKETTLISIALVSENDRCFYAEFTDYDKSQVDDWIRENVINNLYYNQETYLNNARTLSFYHVGRKEEIKEKLSEWFSTFDEVELVSDCCHYDMVLLADIFGGAFDIPKNVCPACYDINQDIARYYKISQREAFNKSREEIVKELSGKTFFETKHNALFDAKIIQSIYSEISKK